MKRTRIPITPAIRQRIIAAREKTDLSQEAFGQALRTRVSKDAVVDWENRGKSIDVRDLVAITTLTGVDFSDEPKVAELLSIEGQERGRVAELPFTPYGNREALAAELTAIAEALLGVVRRMRGGGASYADLLGPNYERLADSRRGPPASDDQPPQESTGG